MKESVAITKEANRKQESSPTKSDNSIHRVRNEPERQLGSLRGVIGNITRDGGTPSANSIATELSSMHTAQRASVLLVLQHTHGNRYVQRVVAGIQAKLKVGQPGDMYEQEADRVADAVMRMPEPGVQRQPEEGEEEETLQSKPLANQITSLVQVQRQEEPEEEEEILQTRENPGQTPEVTPDFESRINAIRGGGKPLPESIRTFFEPRFGYDFSQVRVHTVTSAANTARAMNARAFTVGRDIVFDAGEYLPKAKAGKRLLAHELTHVIQQTQSRTTSKQTMSAMSVSDRSTPEKPLRSFRMGGTSPPDISLTLRNILFLQRTIGNQAVGCLIQAKLKIEQSGDKYEQEADRAVEAGGTLHEKMEERNRGDDTAREICQGGITVGSTALRGRTEPNFTHDYSLEDDRCEGATGCSGCAPPNCVRCTGTLVVGYTSSPAVHLPRVPEGLSPCQRQIVQNAIDNILAPHEQEHVQAFNTFNGTTSRSYVFTGCRNELQATLLEMVSSEESQRRAAAQALSDALDPFNPTIDIECED